MLHFKNAMIGCGRSIAFLCRKSSTVVILANVAFTGKISYCNQVQSSNYCTKCDTTEQWCRRRGWKRTPETPKSFDLVKIWTRPLEIWAKVASNVVWFEKIGTQRLQNHMKTFFGNHPKRRSALEHVVRVNLGKILRTPKKCLLLHLCRGMFFVCIPSFAAFLPRLKTPIKMLYIRMYYIPWLLRPLFSWRCKKPWAMTVWNVWISLVLWYARLYNGVSNYSGCRWCFDFRMINRVERSTWIDRR